MQRVLPQNDRLGWLMPAIAAATGSVAAGRAGVILSTSPPIVSHMVAMALKRKFELKWIADFRDPFFNSSMRLDAFSRRYDRVVERRIFSEADFLLANTPEVEITPRRRRLVGGAVKTA